eukprot:XP_001705375.1 Hypothetical protein GL50803_112966 [Giardia lamblia ATCC 50803]
MDLISPMRMDHHMAAMAGIVITLTLTIVITSAQRPAALGDQKVTHIIITLTLLIGSTGLIKHGIPLQAL